MSTTNSALKRPKVIIVGAGLGGVVLGALLEKAGADYDIYERATIVKPLGKVLIQQASCKSRLFLDPELDMFRERLIFRFLANNRLRNSFRLQRHGLVPSIGHRRRVLEPC